MARPWHQPSKHVCQKIPADAGFTNKVWAQDEHISTVPRRHIKFAERLPGGYGPKR
eukprot:CAMPEP_0177593960 /NCGR_PEP_ID=MMETSP0419_2-20121207/9498_1 /TAXON_ID=582737 /ORGANISM="Tetraselmis sp., Strain GSL018" /LENGTH=55 /DNA_ID=CAMNT_0019085181 /DNA_START=472 /DNA_END=635 /DNA_ORIENTATION=-